MNTAADAIDECVERFVREILALIEQVREERRAESLQIVAGMLSETERPAAKRRATASARGPAESPASPPAKKVAAPRPLGVGASKRAPGRGSRAGSSNGEAAPAASATPAAEPRQPAALEPEEAPEPPPTVPSAPAPGNATATQKNEREVVVLAAVRALVRATASEVAARSGQPNGSTTVALRALVARGQIARTDTARGIEYSLASPGDTRPSPVAPPKRRPRLSDSQLSLFDTLPPEPKG